MEEKQEGSNEAKKMVTTRVAVDPGICGFPCSIFAWKEGQRSVRLKIDSDCEQIQKFASLLRVIGMKDLFLPLSRNPIFISAEKSGCHPSCPIPFSVVKAVEVTLGIALPQGVTIRFEI